MQVKPPTTCDQQISILRERGCFIQNKFIAREVLSRVGYYRFSAYFLPFKTKDGRYLPGTDFDVVYHIYEFDRELRQILFSAIEEIEIFFRAHITEYHVFKYSPLGYLDASSFSKRHNHDKFIDMLNREVEAHKTVPFVQHHLQNRNGLFPLWAIIELFSFGALSRFYSDLNAADQKTLSQRLFSETHYNIRSWLRCCSDLRNICAHYGRIYYRKFSAIPANINVESWQERRLFPLMLALKALYPNANAWVARIVTPLSALIEKYSDYIDLKHIGFPINWESMLS